MERTTPPEPGSDDAPHAAADADATRVAVETAGDGAAAELAGDATAAGNEAPAPGSRWRQALGRIAASAPGRAIARVAALLRDGLTDPAAMLPVAFIVALLIRVAWLDLPHRSLIFDEAYYVQAARTLLGWPVPAGAHYAGAAPFLDPNQEHPPLGKLLIAASMLIFGDNGFGWRIPSVLAGMISLFAMYKIVRTTRETQWFGIAVVFILGLENLTLIHGRIATLDMLALAPVLVGSWMALRGRWALAGLAMGVGLLIKLPAMYGIGAVGLLYLLEQGPGWLRARRIPLRELRPMVVFVAISAVVLVVGLAALDSQFSTFKNPVQHIQHMIKYGSNLAGSVAKTQHCPGAESQPWQWIFNDCQIVYLRVDVTVNAGGKMVSSVPSIDFRGAMNPVLVGLIPISMLYAVWLAWKDRSRIALWTVTWAAANYLPFLLLGMISQRIMYLYYMLPTMPALSVAMVLLLMRSGLPKPVRWGLAAAYVVGFLAYYPFRRIP